MAHWLVKTEPGDFSFADLERAARARWDGVKNALAQRHLRAIAPGDEVFVYHTGDEKAVVGLARAASAPYPDPQAAGLSAVDLEAVERLRRPVTLAAIKADGAFAEFALVRLPRLSVMPVPEPLARRLRRLAEA